MMGEKIPEWAKERAYSLIKEAGQPQERSYIVSTYACRAFARYIAAHEEPPVEPLKTPEDELYEYWLTDLQVGARDIIQAALKRGFEIGAKSNA